MITDDDILDAMRMQSALDTPESAARRVAVLLTRRAGREMTPDELEKAARRILGIVKLPLKGDEWRP
ncbi:MAG TPA: hypothetical protein VII92_04255 [Anaerolineae bacterium]